MFISLLCVSSRRETPGLTKCGKRSSTVFAKSQRSLRAPENREATREGPREDYMDSARLEVPQAGLLRRLHHTGRCAPSWYLRFPDSQRSHALRQDNCECETSGSPIPHEQSPGLCAQITVSKRTVFKFIPSGLVENHIANLHTPQGPLRDHCQFPEHWRLECWV